MPWTCCESEELLDNATCPTCGKPKGDYTIRHSRTRMFLVSRKRWIEVQLLDSVGQPAAGHRVKIEQPAETLVHEGELDEDGALRIDSGEAELRGRPNCVVTFFPPAAPATAAPPPGEWIGVSLRDVQGNPARGWRYELFKSGGEEVVARGTLGGDGAAVVTHLEGLSRCELRFLPPMAEAAPPPPAPEGNWIELKLQDGHGNPARGWRYLLFKPGQEEALAGGTLDGEGRRLVGLEPGTSGALNVRFLPPAPEPAPRPAPPEGNWLELELQDAHGNPARGWTYELFEPGSEEVLLRGSLGADGRRLLRVEDPELQRCSVRFSKPAPEPSPLPPAPEGRWIELELQDGHGNPARGWGFELFERGSEEALLSGSLGEDGRRLVRVEGEAKRVDVRFFRPRSGPAEEPPPPRPEGNWIELELQDAHGNPAANWRYEVRATGQELLLARGHLNEEGRGVVSGLADELQACQVVFSPPRARS